MTPKQQRFVEEYLIDGNGTQAAIRAGYSEKTARAIACELLTKPDILKALAEGQTAQLDRTKLTADWVLQQQQVLATSTDNDEVKRKTLRDIGDHLGMYVERTEDLTKLSPEEREVRARKVAEKYKLKLA